MSFGEKIKEARKSKKLTQKQLADKIGAAHNSVSDWENNKNKPDPDTIELLCGVLEITPNYLLASSSDDYSPPEKLLIRKYRSLDTPGREIVDFVLDREAARSQQIAELEKRPAAVVEFHPRSDTGARMVKYFRSVSAGGGVFILGNESASQICISDPDWDDRIDYVINVAGDSMKPDYCDGDKVKVSQRVEMFHGDVGIFVINGSAYIKEYGENELISRNPEYPNISIAEYDNIVCMGKVLGKLVHGYEIFSD